MADLANNSNGIIENFNTKNGNFICGVVEGFYGRPWTTDQRKDLFHKLKRWGMDSYLYAPKDDYKHRAFWRELYSVEEAEHLTSLVTAARDAGITFFYALSPGLDITYSSGKEVAALKRKLEQVSQFGCSAFALLFDDIEPEMSDADKEVFQSFAHAQVSVTNEVFQHLGQPQFLLCPTQYCATRATPNVRNSEYLNTLGAKLAQGIDIMWTGPKVISRVLTLESIEEITEVLRRPPVIWDNLHANDYDQKRVFLGPYAGRSPALIPHLRGVLANPNCEYGANFVPIHTLAQWSRASGNTTPSESVSADIKLETEDTSNNGTNGGMGICAEDALPNNLSPDSYHPRHALSLALRDWLPEFDRPRQANGPPSLAKPAVSVAVAAATGIPPIINTCLALTSTTTTTSQSTATTQLHALAEVCTNLEIPKVNTGILPSLPPLPPLEEPQPMDCGGTEEALPSIEGAVVVPEDKRLTTQDLTLLCDLFYLPFEHGPQGLQLLQEFNWLKGNAHLVSGGVNGTTDGETETNTASEWLSRATKLSDLTRQLNDLFTRLTYCANRELLYELYPYVWDMRGVVGLLDSYVRWLTSGSFPPVMPSYTVGNYTWFSKGWKETFMSGDQEPWVFRGGLTADLQRLIPVDAGQDLFVYKSPDVPSPKIYTIRPMSPSGSDKTAIYAFCHAVINLDSSLDAFPELAGDYLVGPFMNFSPELCLLVEDGLRVVGFAAAALDAQQLHAKLEGAWVSEMRNKYPSSLLKQPLETKAQELINSFHMDRNPPPEAVHAQHPSVMTCSILESVCDASVSKRLLTCLLAALRANGSFGVFSPLQTSDVKTIDVYAKLGFVEVVPGLSPNNIFMARSF